MASKGCNVSCVGYGGLVHVVLKQDLVTWRVDSSGISVPLGSISVQSAVGQNPGAIVAHPNKLLVFVAGSPDKEKDPGLIFVFHLPSGRCVETLEGHPQKVTHLVWVSGQGLVSGSSDGSCRLWGHRGASRVVYETGRTKTFLGDTEPEKIQALAAGENGDLLIGNEGGSVELLKLASGNSQNLLPLWKDRRLKDIPKSALDVDERTKQRIKERIERKKREGTLGETSSDEDKRRKEEDDKANANFNPTDKTPLAKRSGDHDNAISCLLPTDIGAVAATTTAGEVLVAKGGQYSSLIVFRKSYGGSLALGDSGGEARLFTANRGYDADKYEVVILRVEPFEQLVRITPSNDNNMIINLHWSPIAKKVLIAKDEPSTSDPQFLYALDPDGSQAPTASLSGVEEHQDSMSQEYTVSIVEQNGVIFAKTNWSRVRRLQSSDLRELDPLGEISVSGRREMCVHRETGVAYAMRGGYDNFKFDVAMAGAEEQEAEKWVRLCGYEWPINKPSMKKLEDNPVAHMAYLEYPAAREYEARSMIVVMGEMGGLFGLIECSGSSAKFSNFEGAKIGDSSYGYIEACVTWDATGALIAARNGRGNVWVFSWSPQKLHGEFKEAKLGFMTRIEGDRALVAAKDLSVKTPTLAIYDLRALSALQRFSLDDKGAPRCLFGAQGSFFAYTAHEYKEGSSTKVREEGLLMAWPAASLLVERGASPETSAPPGIPLFEKAVKSITTMVLIPDVGLLTAHSKVMLGISVWCQFTGRQLSQLYPPGGGTSVRIMPGPGDRCVFWNIVNGPAGYFRWNAIGMMQTSRLKDGVPTFAVSSYMMVFLEFLSLLASLAQIASFAMRDQGEEALDEAEQLLPDFFRYPAVEYLYAIALKLQDVPVPSVDFLYKYAACLVFVALFSTLFIAQEIVEKKAYLYPKSCWGSSLKLANQLAKMSVQSLALPVLSHLIAGIVCKNGVMKELRDVDCFQREHLLFVFPSVIAAVLLQVLCIRLAYAGYNLSNIDANLNLFNSYYDLEPERQTPSHLIEPVSRNYQSTCIVAKTFLKCLKIAAPLLRALTRRIPLHSGLKFVTFATVSYSSAVMDPFVMRPYNCWIQPCSLQFAADTANTTMYLCLLLAEMVALTALPGGSWLDVVSWMVIPVIFISILTRTNLDMSSLSFNGCCRRRRNADGYVELPEREHTANYS